MSVSSKINLKSFSKEELREWFVSIGEKPFRADQLWLWIYVRNKTDFTEMTNLSKSLISRLSEIAELPTLRCADIQMSKSGTKKYLWELEDGRYAESVYIPEGNRRTICISSQVGCAMGCRFCATATLGFQRNLTSCEIVEQVLAVMRDIGEKPTNLVVMGMGEPFHNYDNLMKALYILNDSEGLALSHRKITISTSGILPQIVRYTQEDHPFQLAISLNATTDEMRSRLMPVNVKYPLQDLLNAVQAYAINNQKRITFEYVLLRGVNDSPEDAKRLLKLVKNIRCKVNLIAYNPVPGNDPFERPAKEQILRFHETLSPLCAPITLRLSKGDDIRGACGQLAGKPRSGSD